MSIDFEKTVTFANGVSVLNCTPHPITFLDSDQAVVVEPCGAKVNARAVEAEAGNRGAAALVRTEFQQTAEGLAELAIIEEKAPNY